MNVTVSLPDEVARAARHMAVDRGVSLSRYVAELIAENVERDGERLAARRRLLEMMDKGFPLGMPDKANRWTRDELHER